MPFLVPLFLLVLLPLLLLLAFLLRDSTGMPTGLVVSPFALGDWCL
jgi:hypothetical protein